MKHRNILPLLTCALLLSVSACKTIDPYTQEEKTSGKTTGALIGATVGAVIGYASAHDKSKRDKQKAILIGAGAGGLTGGTIGKYMDDQERQLTKQLKGSGVSVTRNGNDLTLNMPGNVTFPTGKSSLKEDFTNVLDSVALVLKEYDQTVIEVAGHTDSVGSEESNQSLSEARASSVAGYLVDKDIKKKRILVVGHGETRPIADNNTEEGRELNRRVELTLVPVEADS